jgi:poly(3-hydroxybutyrate) depolymerase
MMGFRTSCAVAFGVLLAVALPGCGTDTDNGGLLGAGNDTPAAAAPPTSCQQSFSPSKVSNGENCAPQSGDYCPQGSTSLGVLQRDPIPCDGVTVSSHTVTAAGLSSDYLALRGDGALDAIYLSLHYLGANTGTYTNVVRLSELAKARKVLVIAPQAPSLLDTNLTSRWPVTPLLEPVDQYVQYLDAVVADVRARFQTGNVPVYVSGLSNGAVMAYHYACRSGVPSAIETVAGDISDGALKDCVPQRAVGSVIIHGTADLITPYEGLLGLTASIPQIHSFFRSAGGCSAADTSTAMPMLNDALQVTIADSGSCADGSRHLLVRIDGGGHSWPGHPPGDSTIDLTTIGLLGPRTANFDATLQGYDLLRLAAGR